MNTIIDALYSYSQDLRTYSNSKEYSMQYNIFYTNKEKLLSMLQGEEKKQLLALIEAAEELEYITGKTEFQEGFKLSIQLCAELFKEK